MSHEPELSLWRAVLARGLADLILQDELQLEDDLATPEWFSRENEDYHNVLCLAAVSEPMIELLVKDTLKYRDPKRLERLLILAEILAPDDSLTT